MSVPTTRVRNSRTVDIDLTRPPIERRPVLRTPRGNAPMACARVEFGFDLDTGDLRWVTAYGDLIDERDIARRERERAGRGRGGWSRMLVRRISVDWRTHEADVPGWLRDHIEQHRPTVGVTAEMVTAFYEGLDDAGASDIDLNEAAVHTVLATVFNRAAAAAKRGVSA